MPEPPESFGDALHRLPADLGDLVKAELKLFRYELRKEMQSVLRVGVGFAIAAALGGIALLALTTTIIAALSVTMPVWVASLIVTVVYGIIAGIVSMTTLAALRHDIPAPLTETQETVKEDVAWIRNNAKSTTK